MCSEVTRASTSSHWSQDDWGLFLANLYAPPRADPPSSSHIQITQTIYTDLDAIRQQLLPHHQCKVYYNQDMRSSVLWRLDYYLPAPAITDYRSRRGAPHKWRVTSSAWASHICMLPKTSLRRRGTLLKTIWDHWWHGEHQWVAGALDGSCLL